MDPGVRNTRLWLRGLDVGRLLAFGALCDFELDLLAFLKGLEAAGLDCREVSEEVFAAIIGSDEAETLGVVEPFNCAGSHAEV